MTDLGGGSTEIVVGELVGGEVRLLGARSLGIGCVRITERVLHSDPPTAAEVAEARGVVSQALSEAGDVPAGRAARWVGVAGTFTTMSALAQNLGEYDPERIHGSVISLDRMREVRERLVASSVTERRSLGAIHPVRADVIGGGAIVVQALCDVMAERAGLSELTVSKKDILDGIAMWVLTRLAG